MCSRWKNSSIEKNKFIDPKPMLWERQINDTKNTPKKKNLKT